MAKLASQKGTGKQGERVYRKKKGGYQKAHIGGPAAISAHNRDHRDYCRMRIAELRADGDCIYREYLSGPVTNWGFNQHDVWVDLNAELVEVWEVDGCAWVIVPRRSYYIAWSRLVRRLGFDTQCFNPSDRIDEVLPPKYRHLTWDELCTDQRFEVWRWRWQQGILAK